MNVLPEPGTAIVAIGPMLAAVVLVSILVIDIVDRRVPNVIVFPAAVAAVAVDLARGSLDALLGAAVALLLFGALAWGGRRWYGRSALGMGDVKLAMLVGALLGLLPGLYALALGMMLAGGAALVALRRDGADRQGTLPYGAALAAGGVVVLAWQLWAV